jgi:hypothetical protein
MIRTTMTTILTAGFLTLGGLTAMAAPKAAHHQNKTTVVAQTASAVPAGDSPKAPEKAQKKAKKAASKEKAKAKGGAMEGAPAATPTTDEVPAKAPEKTSDKK